MTTETVPTSFSFAEAEGAIVAARHVARQLFADPDDPQRRKQACVAGEVILDLLEKQPPLPDGVHSYETAVTRLNAVFGELVEALRLETADRETLEGLKPRKLAFVS